MARTRDIDYNAGYTTRQDGTALSNRALYAEEDGKYTEGKFRRMYKVSQRDFAILKSLGFIVSNEWHHTGRSFNRNDFFEWADAEDVEYSEDNLFPENSLAEKYLSAKKEVSALVKDYDKKNWEFQPVFPTRNIPSFEEYKERLINISGGYTPSHLDFFSYLSEEEEARRKAEHKKISLAGYTIGNAFDRALMHKDIDDKYRSLAIKHIGDDKMREEYFHFYKDEIEDNEKIIKQNETARQHNVQSDGKEKVLTRIAALMGMNNEEAERKTESIFLSVLSKARYDFENTLRNEYDGKVKAVREEIEKKQQDYIKKLLKDGRASRQERVTRQPEYFITEREEMQGRYGWFKASSRYNLPIYYSGISFNDKRSYNHYYKIAQNYSEKIDALREELNKKVANIRYSDIKLHKDVSDEDTSQQKTVSDNESFLRDGLISIMRKAGMEVITDTDAGEKVMASLSGNQERQQKVFEGDGTVTVTDGVNSSIFYSNALKATLDIRQEKATPEQWLKMLEKNGGLKAGEDKWLGLREWLQSRNEPTLTKHEIIDYIHSNEIVVEEVHYANDITPSAQKKLDELDKEYQEIFSELELEKEATAKEMEDFGEEMSEKYGYGWLYELNEQEAKYHDAIEKRYVNIEDNEQGAFNEMCRRYGDDFGLAFTTSYDGYNLEAVTDLYGTISDAALYFLGEENIKGIDSTRLDYTTEGLGNKREIALTVPSIEPYNVNDEIHFGDAGEGRAIAWIRFGETTSPDGERVLAIDEIQSKRHQDGREKGYRTNSVEELNRLSTEAENNRHAYSNYENEIIQKYDIIKGRALSSDDVVGEILKVASSDEIKKLRDLREAELNSLAAKEEYEKTHGVNRRDLVPDAPFEKNWHELAMKRMLRYAAENGYDKIAWTTGELQAERYSIGNVVDSITSRPYKAQSPTEVDGHDLTVHLSEGYTYDMFVTPEGTLNSDSDMFNGKNVREVFGKDLGTRITAVKEGVLRLEDEDLRIGADGMKGFYDEILPRFVDKYAKKWGVRTEDIDLKEVGDTWHSINVTPQMKRDVMQGQPMFFKTANGKSYGFTVNNKIYIDPKIATSETPIHEYSHLWAKAVREGNPKKWDEIKNILLGDESLSPFINDIRKRYPELESEDDLLDEVLAHYSGKRGAERIRKMSADMAQSSGRADSETWFNTLANKMITAIKRFWKVFADFMHIPYSNKEEIADRIMTDLLSGVNPLTELEKIQANAYKAAQLEIITTANPMTDDYHVGIRSIEDIKTFEEAVLEGEGIDSYPDYTAEDAAEALSSGEITVYSSYPIENGTFVSASRMEAEDYAGDSEIYSKRIPLEDVAWIYASEGQLAKIDRNENLKEWFGKSQVKTEDGTPLAVEHRTNKVFTEFDIAHLGENSMDMGNYGSGFYFGTANRVPSYYGENSMMVYLRISNPYTVERNMPSDTDIYSYLAAKMNEPELRKLIMTENGKSISVGEVIDNIKAVDAALSAGNYDAQMATNEELLSYYPRSRRSVFREWKICERIGFIIPASIPYVVKEMIGSEEFSAALKRQGYDGVIAEDAREGNSYREYVAFEPNQVKSATENIGTYRTASRDIRYQYAETLKETSASESKSESENVTETSEVENTKRKLTAEDIEAGGALVDHLRSMGVAVNCDINGNRKAFKTAKQDKSETGKMRAFVNDKGERYGFSYKGEIYLDPRKIDANLPIHEYAHLWCEAFRKLNSEGWNEVVSLMKSDAESWTAVKDLYPTLDNDSDIAEEVIARYSGKHGEERFISELKRMSPKDENYSSRWGNIFKNISKAIQDFWKKMGDSIHMRYSSPEEVYDQVIKDFVDKVNPRKKVTDYLVSRDKEYMEAVESGNKELSSKIFNEALKENIGNGITPFVSVGGYRGSLQHLAHEVKTGNPAVIERIADMMSPLIPSEAVLIPAPSHKGYATDMLALSEAIAQRTGAEIADVLKSDTRVSQYTAKKETGKAIDSDKLGIYAVGEIPNGKIPVIVDNVVDSGNTAEACVRAIGKGVVISLADATKPYAHSASLRSAAPILRDRNNKVIPLSQRFDMSTGKYLGKTKIFFHKVEEPEEVKIQGLKNYTVNDIKDAVNDYIKALFDGNDIGVENITVIGSRSRNEAKPDSDLDILLEYSNKEWKEDDVFNLLHDEDNPLEIEGIRVDINPINPHYSLSTKEWLARDAKWREEEANKKRDKTILNMSDSKSISNLLAEELKKYNGNIVGVQTKDGIIGVHVKFEHDLDEVDFEKNNKIWRATTNVGTDYEFILLNEAGMKELKRRDFHFSKDIEQYLKDLDSSNKTSKVGGHDNMKNESLKTDDFPTVQESHFAQMRNELQEEISQEKLEKALKENLPKEGDRLDFANPVEFTDTYGEKWNIKGIVNRNHNFHVIDNEGNQIPYDVFRKFDEVLAAVNESVSRKKMDNTLEWRNEARDLLSKNNDNNVSPEVIEDFLQHHWQKELLNEDNLINFLHWSKPDKYNNDIKTAKIMAYDELQEKAVKLFGKDFEFDFRNEDRPGLKDIERLDFGEMPDTISIDKIIVKDGALSLYSDDLGYSIDLDSLSQNDMERISEKLTEVGEYLQSAPKISVPTVSDDEENVSVKDANGVETEYTRIHGWTHDDPALIYANTEIAVYFYDSEKKTVENIDNANGIDSYEDREGFFLVRSDEYSEAYRQLEEHDRIEDIEKPYKITIGTDDRHIVPGEYHVEFSKDINAVSHKEIVKLAEEYGGYARIMNNSEWADFYGQTAAVSFAEKVVALNDERMKAEAESVRLSGRNEKEYEALKAVGYNDYKKSLSEKNGSWGIPTTDYSIYFHYAAGLISLREAAMQFADAGFTNFVDEKYTRSELERINKELGKLDNNLRPLINNNLNDKAMKQETNKEISPVLSKYLELKGQHPDPIILFRTGDFYETYQEDAEKASKILGITLTKSTKRKGPDGTAMKIAGFPYHALDIYLPKLIRAGERVAIHDLDLVPKKMLKERGSQEMVTAADNKETQAKASKQDVSDGAVQKEEMKIIEPEKEDKKNILSAYVYRDSGSKKYNLTVTFEEDGEKKREVFIPTAEDLDKFFSEAKGKSKEVVDSIKIALAEKYISAAQNDEQKVSSKTISSKTSEEKYSEKFAEMMIERIEQCQSNWKTPWLAPMSRPVSMSGRPYNGANWFFLMMHTMEEQYKVPVYGTFKNFTDLNYNANGSLVEKSARVTILKDEHSVPVNFHSVKVVNDETGEKISYKEYKELSKEEQEKYSIKSYDGWHPVFNIDQTNLKEARPELYNKLVEQFSAPKVQKGSEMSLPSLDVMVENNLWLCPIKPTYGNDAYYSISKDEIVVPEKRQFEHDEMYYGNMLHEMTHSTGAEGRLNRLKPSSFGSKEYAKEELVAEMTAAMIASQHGMTKYVKEDSVAYLKGWLESLKQEPSFITSVIKDIDKASTMVNRRIDEVENERVKGIKADYSAILEENEQLASKTKVNVMPSIPTPAPTEESVTEEENINVDEVEEQGRGRSF